MRIIIIGGDETVYFLSRQLCEKKHHVTIINRNIDRCKELSRQTSATVLYGDGSHLATLEEAGARQATVVLALTPYDQDNLIMCQIAQKIYGVPRSIARVNDPANEEVFQRLGITTAFSTTRIIASMLEQQTEFKDITEMMTLAGGRIHIADLRLDPSSPAVGKMLHELELGGTLIACIIRDGEVIVPQGLSVLRANDHLLIISDLECEKEDFKKLTGS